jgi:hypothetical protein
VDDRQDQFRSLIAELGDGQRWKLIRTTGWDEFVARLASVMAEVPLRRRQALLMMLLAMSDGNLTPEDVEGFLGTRHLEDDAEVEVLIEWLRAYRPREP